MSLARQNGSTRFWLSTGGHNQLAQAVYESLGGERKALGDVIRSVRIFFDVALPTDWALFVAVVALGTACCAALGAAVATFITSVEAADPLVFGTLLPLTLSPACSKTSTTAPSSPGSPRLSRFVTSCRRT
jgi:hypothetical protein